ncbi:integrase/recombinase xerD homolog [Saccostrea echinata]|uniref:integrase/recombinase xerD homolog n=1 Tax=Saccostrea echinata TaxID=191078 RepID=UPI002A7EDC31|nr:integrase/recombinase xerD homolog [Saccostrea echinata]
MTYLTGIGLHDSIKRNAEKHGVEPGSYLADLCPYLSSWILSSKSDNTNKSYFNAFKRWENFIKVQEHSALPASPTHVALYLTDLLQNGSSQQLHPVNVAVYAIKWAHECAGLPDPTKNSYVTSLQEAARRKASRVVQKKEPITKDVLIELCDKFVDENDLLIVRNLTMILFCFAGFLGFDEVISLTFNDVLVHDEYLVLSITKSKTDQYRQGSEVLVAKGSTSACPVNMYKRYLERLGIHSLRAGGVTVAANSNVDERCLKKHGRWRSDSAIVDSLDKRLMVSRSLKLFY